MASSIAPPAAADAPAARAQHPRRRGRYFQVRLAEERAPRHFGAGSFKRGGKRGEDHGGILEFTVGALGTLVLATSARPHGSRLPCAGNPLFMGATPSKCGQRFGLDPL